MKPSRTKRLLRNSRGQFVVEAVLLMIVSVSLIIFGTKYVRDQKWMSKMVAGPWTVVAGMLESGVWAEPGKARTQHPNQLARHRTPYPKR